MAERTVTLAFAGAGEISRENVTDLLNDFLGFTKDQDTDAYLLFPDDPTWWSDGLSTVLAWADEEDLPRGAVYSSKAVSALADADDRIPSENIGQDLVGLLVEARDTDDSEVYLVLLTEEGVITEEAERVLDLAESYQVKALDLTAGLDDIEFRQPEEQAAEPEPEAPPRRRRRQAPAELTPEDKPLTEEDHLALGGKDEPAPEVQAFVDKVKERAAQHRAGLGDVLDTLQKVADFFEKVDESNAMINLDEVRYRPMTVAARVACNTLSEALSADLSPEQPSGGVVAQEAPSEAPRGRGRPRKDGQPTKPRSPEERAYVEVWDEVAQEWQKKGRGRVPKDAITRLVDPKTGKVVSE